MGFTFADTEEGDCVTGQFWRDLFGGGDTCRTSGDSVELKALGHFGQELCVLLPLENLLWAKLRDYAISRVNPNPRQVFLVRVVKMR